MGAFTADQAVAGSRAVLKIGRAGVTYIHIDSLEDPNDELTWNGTTLTIDLTAESINLLPSAGIYTYQITIITADGKALNGPREEFRAFPSLPDLP